MTTSLSSVIHRLQANSAICVGITVILRIGEIFRAFFILGLTAFGGPVAHLAYFREEFVRRRSWLSDESYMGLVALCQFLPGPASSQVGMAIGLHRGGYAGALAAWIGFTLPSAAVMIAFALGLSGLEWTYKQPVLEGLMVVTVAVVIHAVTTMFRQHVTDSVRGFWCVAMVAAMLILGGTGVTVLMILASGVFGWLGSLRAGQTESVAFGKQPRWGATIWLGVWLGGLVLLPLFATGDTPPTLLSLADAFYRAGSLVFGGGHVVLPLLESEVVPSQWVSLETFLTGYSLVQAMPGPIFTFSAYLGAATGSGLEAILAGTVALIAIFLPSFLLLAGVLPFWEQLQSRVRVRQALANINAAVVGLLTATLVHPIWTHALLHVWHYFLLVVAWVLLRNERIPAWSVVIGGGVAGLLYGLVTQ